MIRRILGPAVLLALAAGCTAPTAGQPGPSATPPGAASPLPPRPQPLPLDGVDLCALLTEQDRAALGLTSGKPGKTDENNPADSAPLCGWDHMVGATDDSYTVVADLHNSAGYRLANTSDTHLVDIAGFGAFEHTQTYLRPERSCQVVVDVAPAQSLLMRYDYFGPQGASNHDLACRKARTVAAAAVVNLRQQKGS